MRHFLFFVHAVILFSSQAYADIVNVSDGSRLTGDIVQIDEGIISLETTYAGTIKIKQSEVVSFETIEPISLRLKGGETISGSVVKSEGNKLRIRSDGRLIQTDSSEVLASWRDSDEDPKIIRRRAKREAAQKKWNFITGFDLLGKQGNTEEFSLGANLEVVSKGPKDELSFRAEYEDREKNGDKTADRVAGGTFYESFFGEIFGWYLRSEIERDAITAVDLRSTSGAGVSYRIVDGDKQTLVVRSGLGYRYTGYDAIKEDESALTIDLGLTHKYQFNDSFSLDNELTYVPGISGSGNNRFVYDGAFVFPLGDSGKWNFKMGIKSEYETEPAVAEKLDTTYYSRMSFSWD